MPAPHETIARRLAARFAPELGARLPALTEQVLAGEAGDETPFRSVDPVLVIAYANWVVGISALAWNVYMGLRQLGHAKQREEALARDVEDLQRETALLKGMLLADLRHNAPILPKLAEPVRERLLDAAAEEALAEAAQVEKR